jgi:serine/threonine protein kinase
LFDAGGEAKLSDFGVAHVSDVAATVTKGLIGTLAYMAPEQRRGEAASIESDIYSVGAVFWEMLTGAPPKLGSSFLSDKLTPENKQLAERLIGEKHTRPSSAREAESLIFSLPWPHEVPPRRLATPHPTSIAESRTERLEPLPDGSFFDRLLQRRVVLLPAEADLIERARRIANSEEGRALLRYHESESKVWVLATAEAVTRELKQS